MRETQLHQINAGDTILMRSQLKNIVFARIGTAVTKHGSLWVNDMNMTAASVDPHYKLYKLTPSELEQEPWTQLLDK